MPVKRVILPTALHAQFLAIFPHLDFPVGIVIVDVDPDFIGSRLSAILCRYGVHVICNELTTVYGSPERLVTPLDSFSVYAVDRITSRRTVLGHVAAAFTVEFPRRGGYGDVVVLGQVLRPYIMPVHVRMTGQEADSPETVELFQQPFGRTRFGKFRRQFRLSVFEGGASQQRGMHTYHHGGRFLYMTQVLLQPSELRFVDADPEVPAGFCADFPGTQIDDVIEHHVMYTS